MYAPPTTEDAPRASIEPHWVITGGESGPGHRPIYEAWVTQIRDTCQDADVAFFFKLLCTKSKVTVVAGAAR